MFIIKKYNPAYTALWCLGPVGVIAVLIALAFLLKIAALFVAAIIMIFASIIFLGVILDSKMEKGAKQAEDNFAKDGFSYQYKFSSSSGIFYIDEGGRIGVIWKFNPTELQFVDASKLSKIRTNTGRQFNNGTSLVSCQFLLEGKKYSIYTLRVSGGSLVMSSPKVLEAISKADKLCEMLKKAQESAVKAAT